jgi:hypothetical protein
MQERVKTINRFIAVPYFSFIIRSVWTQFERLFVAEVFWKERAGLRQMYKKKKKG